MEEGHGRFPATSMVRNGPSAQDLGALLRVRLHRGSGYCLLHSSAEKILQAKPSRSLPDLGRTLKLWLLFGVWSGCCLLTKRDQLESTRTHRGHSRALLVLFSASTLFKELPVLLGSREEKQTTSQSASSHSLVPPVRLEPTFTPAQLN